MDMDTTPTAMGSSPASSMATSMSAHKPFKPRKTQPDHFTTAPSASSDPSQPQHNTTFQSAENPTPTKKASAEKTPKQKLILLKDSSLTLSSTILDKIKTSSPLRPLDLPLLTLASTHGPVKVLLHCQTTRLYLQKNGQYLGDLPWLFEAAGVQLKKAMEERSQQRGPGRDGEEGGCTYSAVMREDEVLVDDD